MLVNCVLLEKTLESPLDCKEKKKQPILREINPEYSLQGLMLKLQYFDHLMRTADSMEKTPMLGKDWRQEEKVTIEDEMVGWHHQLNGHEFEQALGVGDGQGSLVCCSPWVLKELNMTERLNWTELKGLPTEVWPVLSNYIHKDPVSKWGHILRYWVLEFSFLFFFRKTQLNPFRSSEERPHEENKHLDNVRYFVENKVRG